MLDSKPLDIASLKAMTVAPIHSFKFDFERLKRCVLDLVEKYPFDEMNQLCLTSVREDGQSMYEGTGRLSATNSKAADDKDYRYFHREFLDSYLHEIYRSIQNISNLKIGRFRIMRLRPNQCYSFHRDRGVRFHIAIQTNPHCYLMFQPAHFEHVPTGILYFANTLELHSAMNGGSEDRYHLVFSTYDPTAEALEI